jgi:hypothetical protein
MDKTHVAMIVWSRSDCDVDDWTLIQIVIMSTLAMGATQILIQWAPASISLKVN